MKHTFEAQVAQLLAPFIDADTRDFFAILHVPSGAVQAQLTLGQVHRSSLAFALSAVLFAQLVQRVPEAAKYVQRCQKDCKKLVLDHGALRTVAWRCGALPPGESAFTRFLSALGYELAGVYPLPKLKMTGRSYAQQDDPEQIAQYFVSELHPEQFSLAFQVTVGRVLSSSVDPLKPEDVGHLEALRRDHALPLKQARALLPTLVGCFAKQHGVVAWADYEALRAESAEMAWIATEGNVFNHGTDRVSDVQQLSCQLREEGYSVKAQVEVSKNGRVRQTAIQAQTVERIFLDGDELIQRSVPGSFFEFISRDRMDESGLDLSFDSGNATGIFKMTQAPT